MTNNHPSPARRHPLAGVTLACLMAVAILAGCGKSDSYHQMRRAALSSDSNEGAFQSIANTLNALDRGNELRQYSLDPVLDPSLSSDEKPVLAVLSDDPDADGKQFNILTVVSKNANFVRLRVKEGDFVNFLLKERIAAGGDATLTERRVLEFRVVQVLGPEQIRLFPSLKIELVDPSPIVIRRQSNKRTAAIIQRLDSWHKTGKPAIAWDPTPDKDAIDQLVSQLNQWAALQRERSLWQVNPMIAALGSDQRQSLGFGKKLKHLESLAFEPNEGRLLQEAVWLRDIARRTGGNNGLEQFAALFDWVVRNLQLETEKSISHIAQRPWQALASGRATAVQRAWVTILAGRQLHLQAVMLALPGKSGSGGLRPWAIGLWHEGDLHLFDPTLGLGIGPLSELRADAALLRKLDLDDSHRYPLEVADLSNVIALIEATPLYFSRRAKLVESQLAGGQRVVLASEPNQLASAIGPLVSDVRLWDIASATQSRQARYNQTARDVLFRQFEAFAINPKLWKGRVLQFKGEDHRLEEGENQKLIRVYDYNQDPRFFFLRDCRFPKSAFDPSLPSRLRSVLRVSHDNATYWLGQMAFEEGDYPVAIDYFQTRTLEASPQGPWTDGARYNLARSHERLAEFYRRLERDGHDAEIPAVLEDLVAAPDSFDKAFLRARQIEHLNTAKRLYEEGDSAQRHGNHLRARRLVMPKVLPSKS